MPFRRGFGPAVRPYAVPQSFAPPAQRRPGDRSGVGFAAEPRPEAVRNGPQPAPGREGPRAPPTPAPPEAAAVPDPPAPACASCGRGRPDVRHACTWTVQVGEVPISYVSHDDWRRQARPERGAAPESVPEPFRGCTLEDRHPREPKAGYSDAERERLCPACGTLVVHWPTHAAGRLHRARAPPAVPSAMDVVAALQVLQAARPDLMAAPLASASPEALLAAARAQGRPSRWGPEPSRRAWTAAAPT